MGASGHMHNLTPIAIKSCVNRALEGKEALQEPEEHYHWIAAGIGFSFEVERTSLNQR